MVKFNLCMKLSAFAFALGALVGGTITLGVVTRPKAVVTTVPYQWKVIRVIDGDTFEVDAKFFPAELGNIQVRAKGIDTPEKGHRAKCSSERELADKATEFARRELVGKTIVVSDVEQDKYGGRLVGVVSFDGKSYSEILISQQMAVPYAGKTKQSWC